MKKAVKYTLMISGIISLCISCLFSYQVYADSYPTRYWVDVPYVREYWNMIVDYDYESELFDFNETVSYSDLDAYIDQGTPGATDNVDSNFPAFVVADTSDHDNSNAIPMNRKCIEFSELSSIWVNTNGATGNQYANNIIDWLMDLNPLSTYDSGSSYIKYEVLYKLGYRITAKCQTQTTTNNTCYLFTLQKIQGSDHINFYGSTSNTTYFDYHEIKNATFMQYTRYSFDVSTVHIHGTNPWQYLNFNSGSDTITINLNTYALNDQTANTVGEDWSIYEINDMVLVTYGSTFVSGEQYKTYTFKITGRSPYVTITRFYGINSTSTDYSSILLPNRTTGTFSDVEYLKGAGSDLTSINQHLVTIESLLSDLQVTEINNIYQDITNEYNVDIDLTLNNVIDDLKLHINDFDFTDENYQIPENDLQKISGFRLIFSNMIQTMNTNGLGLMWFLPLVLLIIGALL